MLTSILEFAYQRVLCASEGFYRPTFALERAEQTRYDSVKENWDRHIEFRIRSLDFELQIQGPPHTLYKECLPTRFPIVRLGQVAAVSGRVEVESSVRGLGIVMEHG